MFNNPLLLPLICTILLLVAIVSAVIALAINRYLDAEAIRRLLLNALPRPDKGVERSYLEALEQALGKTPALLAVSEAADLRLFEAFSPLTLSADQDEPLHTPKGDELSLSEIAALDRRFLEKVEIAPGPRPRVVPAPRLVVSPREVTAADRRFLEKINQVAKIPSQPSELSREVAASDRRFPNKVNRVRKRWQEQLIYWGLWSLAQAITLCILIAAAFWLISSLAGDWRSGWWRIALALALAVAWFFIARWLHGWLVADTDVLTDLLEWEHRRSQCLAEDGSPGAEIWANLRLLIRGDPGCGKTTLLRHIATICARERRGSARRKGEPRVRDLYGWPKCPFPIYIPLRALNLGRDQVDLLGCYSQKLGPLLGLNLRACDSRFFSRHLERGGCLVLLDAFDELRDVNARTQVARLIAALPGGPNRRPNRFVVTSRIVGYEGQLDGYDYARRRVENLDDNRAAAFVRARYQAIAASERRAMHPNLSWNPAQQATNLVDRLSTNPGLRRLSRNPLLLSLTVALHYDHRGKGLQLPEERYRLYEEALRLLVRDWERRKELGYGMEPTDERSDLKLDEKLRLLRELAWMMFEQVGDGADPRAFAVVRGDFAKDKLAEVLPRIPGFAPEKTGEARLIHARSEAERWLQDLGQRGGVLQELGNVPGTNEVEVQFAHLTFQEYLAARAAASEDGERRLSRIIARWDRPAWREVLLLYAASHDATPIVRHLLAQASPTSDLLAGAVLLERPISLSEELQQSVLDRLHAMAFTRADVSEEDALEALRQLEERPVLPKRQVLLAAIQSAPLPVLRAKTIELVAEIDGLHREPDSSVAEADQRVLEKINQANRKPKRAHLSVAEADRRFLEKIDQATRKPARAASSIIETDRRFLDKIGGVRSRTPRRPQVIPVPEALQTILLNLLDREQDCRPRLAAGSLLARYDPRF
jgi:energy-coupling factor transporter ATP-binding protein EcfA2